jgi:vancomycin resistance protein YoaR
MKFNTRKMLNIVAVLALGILFSLSVSTDVSAKGVSKAPKGMYIGETDVSGMTEKQINKVVAKVEKQKAKKKITLKAGKHKLEASGAELGVKAQSDIAKTVIKYSKTGNPLEKAIRKAGIDEGKKKTFEVGMVAGSKDVAYFLDSHSSELSDEAVNNGLKRENGGFVFVKGKEGEEIDPNKATKKVMKFIKNEWNTDNDSITLETHKVMPKGNEKQLSKVKDLLGTFQTTYTATDLKRNQNIARAASLLNGTILYKGDELSVYKTIGPTDSTNGYVAAGVYVDGQVAEGEGGGVCQVSTTLYNAAILSELGIELRASHSMLVHYVEPSFDAAIAAASDGKSAIKNLILKNNYDSPVYIETITTNTSITVNIYGEETRPKNREVTFENEILEATEISHKYEADPSLPVGTISKKSTGSIGYKARLWKVVKVDGVEQSRKLMNRSTYKMLEENDLVGVASSDPARTQRMMDAIASGDQHTVEDTARALAGEEGTEFKVPVTEKSILAKKAEEANAGATPPEPAPESQPAPAN